MKQHKNPKHSYRRIALWSAAALVASGGIVGTVKLASRPIQENGPAISVQTINAEDWAKGNREAKVILTEYSDFQCPACAFYHPLLKKLSEEFGDKLAIVYRHFPLPIHPNAKAASYAAEAAGQQGKFWEMHDMIFINQKEWKDERNPEEIFASYARALNLNIEQFMADFSSEKIKTRVEKAYQDAIKLGLNYTPTFFLNGKKISNPKNYEELRSIIIQAINENH